MWRSESIDGRMIFPLKMVVSVKEIIMGGSIKIERSLEKHTQKFNTFIDDW